jgi:2-polyprenyl-6-methoxyphenol hydroxylase-like FAD-dependent oxidoreductase
VSIHILGAGPVGLLTAATLQRTTERPISLYEKRPSYTRTRMVHLSPFLLAQEMDDYRPDAFDGENMRAIFEPEDLDDLFAAKRATPPRVQQVLTDLCQGFAPLNVVESSLNDLLAESGTAPVRRVPGEVDLDRLSSLVKPGDIVIDCTGRRSLLRDTLATGSDISSNDSTGWHGSVLDFVLEYALVVTFVIDEGHVCTEHCKYYGNEGNTTYQFIPSIARTYSGEGTSHVTGVVHISEDDFERLPSSMDQGWLDTSGDEIAASINRFIDQHIVGLVGVTPRNLSIIKIPLNLYRARRMTNVAHRSLGQVEEVSAFLLGDASMGSPYFQSISLGFEGALFLCWLLAQDENPTAETLRRHEHFMNRQWARVYMRSQEIRINKQILEAIGDHDELLARLHIF